MAGLLIKIEPGVGLEGHESHGIVAPHDKHDVTVGLLVELEEPLFNHLSVVDEANEFPFAQIYHFLWHVLDHVNNSYFGVLRIVCLVSQKWIIDDPRLGHWLLRIVKLLILLTF